MGTKTGVEWTDHTFNPWWGCVKISPGCANCYAKTMARRFGTVWGQHARRRFFGPKHWEELETWNRAAERDGVQRRVFTASMADVCELLPSDHPDTEAMAEARETLRGYIRQCRHLIFQLLTKRPENFALLGLDWENTPNAWAGVSVENQEQANRRIPFLLTIPAKVRLLSCEPLLRPVDLKTHLQLERCKSIGPEKYQGRCGDYAGHDGTHTMMVASGSPWFGVNGMPEWVIVGGESGHNARPCRPVWIQSIVAQCKAASVPCFVKQLGANVVTRNDMVKDQFNGLNTGWPDPCVEYDIHGIREDYQGADCRIRLRDRKGGDMSEWPAALRVREFPA